MLVYLNGAFVDETAASVPVTDRGFLLGDALFETVRAAGGVPLLWEAHGERMRRGLELLGLLVAWDSRQFEALVVELLSRNGLRDAVIRITITRGSGARGYSPRGAGRPTILLTAQPAPAPFGGLAAGADNGWKVITSQYRVPPPSALAGIKHTNRLSSVLARMEADAAGVDESLMLSVDGAVAEASGSNLVWWEAGELYTPATTTGALPGVMLEFVGATARGLGWGWRTARADLNRVWGSAGAFLTNSVHLMVPITQWDGRPLASEAKNDVLRAELSRRLLA